MTERRRPRKPAAHFFNLAEHEVRPEASAELVPLAAGPGQEEVDLSEAELRRLKPKVDRLRDAIAARDQLAGQFQAAERRIEERKGMLEGAVAEMLEAGHGYDVDAAETAQVQMPLDGSISVLVARGPNRQQRRALAARARHLKPLASAETEDSNGRAAAPRPRADRRSS